MRLLNIGSGSSGNATYIGSRNTHILIDAGISRKRINAGLNSVDAELKDLSAILITHEHIDHISSLGVLLRSAEIPVYATKETIEQIKRTKSLGSYNEELFQAIVPDRDYIIGDFTIRPLSISHDAANPVCYRAVENDSGKSLAVVTDLGHPTEHLCENLDNLDILMLEANHDVRMLEVGPYPYSIKQRIMGNFGHISNETSGKLIARLLHDNIKEIILGHVSRENNTRELAKLAVETEIDRSDTCYKAKDFEINVAMHDMMSKLMEA